MKAKQWMVIGFLLMSMAVKGENRVKMCDGCLAVKTKISGSDAGQFSRLRRKTVL